MSPYAKFGLPIAGAAALLLMWPRRASAGTGLPSNAQEAYGLAMNPSLTDSDKVQVLAQYLASEKSHPEWAAAAQKRAYDLKAEALTRRGLALKTPLAEVQSIAEALKPTHNDLALILASRIMVQQGKQAPPTKPFDIKLPSGSGVIRVDLRAYAP